MAGADCQDLYIVLSNLKPLLRVNHRSQSWVIGPKSAIREEVVVQLMRIEICRCGTGSQYRVFYQHGIITGNFGVRLGWHHAISVGGRGVFYVTPAAYPKYLRKYIFQIAHRRHCNGWMFFNF